MKIKPRANLACQKSALLEKLDEGEISVEELLKEWELALRLDDYDRAKKKKVGQIFYFISVAIMLSVMLFKSDRYLIDPESSDIIWSHKTWWGIKDVQRSVRWSGRSWKARGTNGEWYSFISEYDESEPDEKMPGR